MYVYILLQLLLLNQLLPLLVLPLAALVPLRASEIRLIPNMRPSMQQQQRGKRESK